MFLQINPLIQAAKYGNIDAVRILVEMHDVNCVEFFFGGTPLMYASEYGHLPVVEYLLERGADMEARDNIGNTPLMYAVGNQRNEGCLSVVEYLEQRGADLNVVNYIGDIPLTTAAFNGSVPLIEYLVDQGGDIYAQNETPGHNPINCAAEAGNLAVVEYFIEQRGVNVDVTDARDYTPLYVAAKARQAKVAAYLCARGACVNHVADGNTAVHAMSVHWANYTTNATKELLVILMRRGADLLAPNKDGKSGLHLLAAQYTSGNEAMFLQGIQMAQFVAALKTEDLVELRRLFEEERIDANGNDYLIYAATTGNLTIFEYLVERGATIPDITSEDDGIAIQTMLQRRRDWIEQAILLSRQRRLPLTVIRTIHEYVIGFNWAAVREAFT